MAQVAKWLEENKTPHFKPLLVEQCIASTPGTKEKSKKCNKHILIILKFNEPGRFIGVLANVATKGYWHNTNTILVNDEKSFKT